MKLYDIDERLRELGAMLDAGEADAVDGETGEIIDLAAELEAMQMAREAKIEGVACWCKELAAEIDAIAAERRALSERLAAKEKQLKGLEGWLQAALTDDAGKAHPFESARAVIRFRRTTAVEIEPGAKLPSDYLRQTVKIEPNRMAIKDALKAGEIIPGAALVEKRSMTIR